MFLQRICQRRVLKLFQLECCCIRRDSLSLSTSHKSTTNNVKKAVRYTSIRKAKPQTLLDIAKIIQQKKTGKEMENMPVIRTAPAEPSDYDSTLESLPEASSSCVQDLSDVYSGSRDSSLKDDSDNVEENSVSAVETSDVLEKFENVPPASRSTFTSLQTSSAEHLAVSTQVLLHVSKGANSDNNGQNPVAFKHHVLAQDDESAQTVPLEMRLPDGEDDPVVVSHLIPEALPRSNNCQGSVLMKEERQTNDVPVWPAGLDPVQRLFLEKLRDYSAQHRASGGLIDAGPEYYEALNKELAKLQRIYGGGELTKFPDFEFSDPVLEEQHPK